MEEVKKTVTKVTFGQFGDVVNIETVDNNYDNDVFLLYKLPTATQEGIITKEDIDNAIQYFKEAAEYVDTLTVDGGILDNVAAVTDSSLVGDLSTVYDNLLEFINDCETIRNGKINEVEYDTIEKLVYHIIENQ